MSVMRSLTPPELMHRIESAGYYPRLVSDTLDVALANEEVTAHLVHAEATFDLDTVRRHLSVLTITPTRLILVHADDHGGDEHGAEAHAIATSESVPLKSVGPVMLTHVVTSPESYEAGTLGREITLTMSWGSVTRIDMEPASCGDPDCTAEHGYTGAMAGDDLSMRISAEADGQQAVDEAIAFAAALSAATAAAL